MRGGERLKDLRGAGDDQDDADQERADNRCAHHIAQDEETRGDQHNDR